MLTFKKCIHNVNIQKMYSIMLTFKNIFIILTFKKCIHNVNIYKMYSIFLMLTFKKF